MARRGGDRSSKPLSPAAWIGVVCGIIIVVALAVMGVGIFLVTARPGPPPEARLSAQPADAQSAGLSAPPLRQQIAQVDRARQSSQPVPVRLTIREAELNDLASEQAPQDIRDLRFHLGDGSVAGQGNITWRGQTVTLTIRAVPTVQNGQVRVRLLSLKLGRIDAPTSIQDRIRDQLAHAIQQMLSGNVQVQSIEVRPDVMIVQGLAGGQ